MKWTRIETSIVLVVWLSAVVLSILAIEGPQTSSGVPNGTDMSIPTELGDDGTQDTFDDGDHSGHEGDNQGQSDQEGYDSGQGQDEQSDSDGDNDSPVANAGGPYVGDENSTIVLDGSGSYDPNDVIVSWEWNVDGDNIYDYTGETISCIWPDDYDGNIYLRVTDTFGDTDVDITTVSILNSAPLVTAMNDQSVDEDSMVALDLATFIDGGTLDTHTAIVDWGDGAIEAALINESECTGIVSASHTYPSEGIYSVIIVVTDNNGGSGTDMLTITVYRVGPVVETIVEAHAQSFEGEDVWFVGDPIKFTSIVTQSCGGDVFMTWDWGDGSSPVTVSHPGCGCGSDDITDFQTHTYRYPGQYVANLVVQDCNVDKVVVSQVELTVWGPRDLKYDAVERLNSIEGSSQCIQNYLDFSANAIERSLRDCLWQDDIRPDMDCCIGLVVFVDEKLGVIGLELAKNADMSLEEAVDETIAALVKADEMIAKVAISDAIRAMQDVESHFIRIMLSRHIEKAEISMQRAEILRDAECSAEAIMAYGHSWMYVQTAIDLSEL
ncbi:MAG: PKD domain-containing protein [Chloroflexota bacterium]|nr:PKD domain-containing protein [Chloroflexota bacterium]